MAMATAHQTERDLEQRFGPLEDLATLARFCQVSPRRLRRLLEQAGVPIIEVGRKRLVVRDLAEHALGLDYADLLLEIRRNEDRMRQLQFTPDGRPRTVDEYARETSALAREALRAPTPTEQP